MAGPHPEATSRHGSSSGLHLGNESVPHDCLLIEGPAKHKHLAVPSQAQPLLSLPPFVAHRRAVTKSMSREDFSLLRLHTQALLLMSRLFATCCSLL